MPDQPPHVTALSPDTIGARVEMLRELFPEARAEDGLDFHKLREALGEFVDDAPERYSFSWAGKRDAIRLLQMPSRATLLPAPEESLDWDTTANLFIEGDNLEALKLLLRPYYGRVKMIYIDPPYNTGNDFIYPDDYRDPLGAYLEQTGQVKGQGDETHRNQITSGRRHSGWLSMMYPRLWLARQLLSDDGVIFISIDDNEVHNLRMLMNEVFGEESFVATFCWRRRMSTGLRDEPVSPDQEYVLAYAREKARLSLYGLPTDPANYPWEDERGWFADSDLTIGATREQRPGQYYPISNSRTGRVYEASATRVWRFWPETMCHHVEAGNILWPDDPAPRHRFQPDRRYHNRSVPRYKTYYAAPDQASGLKPVSTWIPSASEEAPADDTLSLEAGRNETATRELRSVFGERVMDYPKPLALLSSLARLASREDDIILDFFAGSCTTAQAVLELNREDGGNRRFIMVQLPEPTGREDFPTIADIGKERIRRVVARMREQAEQDDGKLDLTERETPEDLGFRVFKLAASNYRNWAGVEAEDTGDLPDQLARQMELFADGLVDGWTPEAVIAEVTLKEAGFGLGYAVEALGEALWRVTDPDTDRCFIISLADDLRLEDVEPLGLDKETLLVCRATALDDTTAGNLELQCRLRVI